MRQPSDRNKTSFAKILIHLLRGLVLACILLSPRGCLKGEKAALSCSFLSLVTGLLAWAVWWANPKSAWLTAITWKIPLLVMQLIVSSFNSSVIALLRQMMIIVPLFWISKNILAEDKGFPRFYFPFNHPLALTRILRPDHSFRSFCVLKLLQRKRSLLESNSLPVKYEK